MFTLRSCIVVVRSIFILGVMRLFHYFLTLCQNCKAWNLNDTKLVMPSKIHSTLGQCGSKDGANMYSSYIMH